MKKNVKKSSMPSLREAFVVRENEKCDYEKEDMEEAGPPPIPGSQAVPPPIPGSMNKQKHVSLGAPQATSAGQVEQLGMTIRTDVMSLEKEVQLNKGKYPGLDIDREVKQLRTDIEALTVKLQNWQVDQYKQYKAARS
jgi:hypothetical protein